MSSDGLPPVRAPRSSKKSQSREEVIRLAPLTYIHVLDNNTHCRRVVVGPATFTKQEHEKILFREPKRMIVLPPQHYIEIDSPALRDDKGELVIDEYDQVKVRFGDREIRTAEKFPTPFPLYPGEEAGAIKPLTVVAADQALVLQALRPYTEGETHYQAGEEWLFKGPATYIPAVEVEVKDTIEAQIIQPSQALKLRARRECVDAQGQKRRSGEEWLIRAAGAYLPSVHEEIIGFEHAKVLSHDVALHLRALKTFTDIYGQRHKAGEEWLVTSEISPSHICDVFEVEVGLVPLQTLTDRQFCVVEDPVVKGEQKLGSCILRSGVCSFFLQPGERLRNGIENVHILQDHDALLLRSTEAFLDTTHPDLLRIPEKDESRKDWKGIERIPGDLWMVYGPCDYTPGVQVEVVEKRQSIPLNDTEGIYVRDTQTGKIRSVVGHTYMLAPREVLWEKQLSKEVELLLQKQGGAGAKRDPSRVVTFNVKAGHVVQVYNYQSKRSRVLVGPALVMLGPEEQFTVMRLSGGTPKIPNKVSVIALRLGPKFMTDEIAVETSDHARLKLKLSYNWHFDIDRSDPEAAQCVFTVRDFVGDACKAMASRIRGAVASSTFDNFHKHSATLIRLSVMGRDTKAEEAARAAGQDVAVKPKERLLFPQNKLVITNVDVQSVEPVDAQTRESLQKSVTLAIEITTKSQEAESQHQADEEEEIAKGALTTQRLKNKADAEAFRKELIRRETESMAIQQRGEAGSLARGVAKAEEVMNQCAVAIAQAEADAMKIATSVELEIMQAQQEADIKAIEKENQLELERKHTLSEIEASKFKRIVESIGAETLEAIARAGPEMQAKLLEGLGLQGYMVTDGSSPINLFKTAEGLVSTGNPGAM